MELKITIPDDMKERVLEAFGAPDINTAIHMGPYIPATVEHVEERLKIFVRNTLYSYEDNKAQVQTMRQRGEETW